VGLQRFVHGSSLAFHAGCPGKDEVRGIYREILKETLVQPDINHILSMFMFEGEFVHAEPHGYGHIHDTYLTTFREENGGTRRYILQKVNQYVFKDPLGLMKNIQAVTSHLREKIRQAGGDPERETLNLLPTVDGKYLYQSESGEVWRGYFFIENAQTYQVPQNPTQVYHDGKAYGNFQKLLSDFPTDHLIETIPDFHNTPKRFQNLIEAIQRDPLQRARDAEAEITFAMQREGDASLLVDKLAVGEFPQRVTHNDTKFNNVMIDDDTGEGICVIDLDTVMPGLSGYDFGDAIRSIANKGAEDEGNFDKVGVDLGHFESFTRGFLEATRDFLSPAETELLPLSARMMTLENSIRFLTDYLEGDVYYKTAYANHNLVRCRSQFKLVEDMEEKMGEMNRLVERCRNG
jgi:Ser/Thr protein kinase RdoA (MazF antagonist)